MIRSAMSDIPEEEYNRIFKKEPEFFAVEMKTEIEKSKEEKDDSSENMVLRINSK